ncbi:MAG: tetratricopeptide repeat protein [Deltaproteobacteria bacterium]|nr:tetratricopeptide repeat protein [Deltaproteobacteria bacterium]
MTTTRRGPEQRRAAAGVARGRGVAMALLATLACQPRGSSTPPVVAAAPADHADPAAADPRVGSGEADAAEVAAVEEDAAPKPRERPKAEPVEGRDDALSAVLHGNPDGAIAALTPMLAAKPKDIELRLALARAQITVGALEQAQAVLEDKRGAPLDVAVVQLRVHVHRQRGQLREAEALLEEAVRKHADAPALLGDLVAVRVDTGRRADATTKKLIDRLYDAYDAGKVDDAASLLAVAIAALARGGKGGYHDANMVLEEAEAKTPVEAGSWVGDRVRLLRAAVFLEKYAADEAATTFELLLARDPWHPDALAGMAMVHIENLRFAPASRAAAEALMVDPKHPEAHAALARIALIEGRADEVASHTSGAALTIDPTHERSLAVLAALAIARADDKGYAATRDRVLARNPVDGFFFKDLSDILGFLHLYPEADEVLREGAALAPNDPYVQSALGLNLLRLGNETDGRAALERSWKGDPFNARTRNVLDLYENQLDKHYDVESAGGFTVRLPKQDREFVQPVLLEFATRSRKALDGFYHVDAGKLRLEFFASPDEFSVRTVGVPSLGAVAVCFGPLITFIGPYSGRVNLDLVMRHELAHVYAIRRSKGRVPRWFTEGLSEWESEQADPAWARESAALLTEARRLGKLRKLSELELAFIRAESPIMMEAAYATAAYAIRYLAATYGRDKLIAILDGYASGKQTPELFEQHLGKPLSTVEGEFETWFTGQLRSKLSGWSPANKAERSDPRLGLWQKAQQQVEANDHAEAVRTLETLVSRGGDGFATRMAIAQLLQQGKTPGAARRHLEAAQAFHTESIEPYVKLAELARTENDVAKEKAVLRGALAIDADSLDPAARLLMLALVTDDKDAVAYARTRAAGLAPLHPIVLAARALQLQAAGKAADAKAAVQRASKALGDAQGKGPVDTLVVVALAQAAVGDRDGAKQTAAQALAGKLPEPARKRLAAL